MGFEPTTPTLARLCSTPELRPHSVGGLMTESRTARKRGKYSIDATFYSRRRLIVQEKVRKRKKAPEGAFFDGAGDGIRTHDPNLGKVVLYP